MTNEEAILYLENALCELDAGIKVYRGTVKEEFIEQRECFTTSLSALREQAERDKGCEICNGKLPCDNGCDGFCDICNVPDVYRTIHKTGHYNYCPMCGKSLEEVKHD